MSIGLIPVIVSQLNKLAAAVAAISTDTSSTPMVSEQFLSSKVWTVPKTGTYEICAVGAGGSAGSLSMSYPCGGGGGGGCVFKTVELPAGTVVTLIVGAAGTNLGSNGGNTSVTINSPAVALVAGGGQGGISDTARAAAGGTASGGDKNYPGGKGGMTPPSGGGLVATAGGGVDFYGLGMADGGVSKGGSVRGSGFGGCGAGLDPWAPDGAAPGSIGAGGRSRGNDPFLANGGTYGGGGAAYVFSERTSASGVGGGLGGVYFAETTSAIGGNGGLGGGGGGAGSKSYDSTNYYGTPGFGGNGFVMIRRIA